MNPRQDPDLAGIQPQPQQPQQPVPQPYQQQPVQQFQPLPPADPTYAQPQYGAVFTDARPKKSGRRKVAFAFIVVLLAVLLGAGAVFGLYLPSRPENVYQTGLTRTGMALDKLAGTGVETKKLESLESSDFSGTVKVTGPDKTYGGTFSTRYDKNQSDSTLGYKVTNGLASADGDEFNVQLLTDLADGKTYPDIYFKVSGLAGLGIDVFLPGAEAYDGKWISATSSYLQSMVPAPTDTTKTEAKKSDFTAADAAALSKIVTATTREYVFTADASKAVLVQKQFKGAEKMDTGRTANRYEVGINKDHAKDYCKALITNVMAADAFKRLPGAADIKDLSKAKTDAITNCQDSIDKDIKAADSFDMWVDKKTKLIHKVRFIDEKEKATYFEIGQNYTSGSNIPLFTRFHSDKDKYDVTLTLDVDSASNTTKGSVTASYNQTDAWKLEAGFTFKPYKGDVAITKPKDAVPIQTVLEQFGVSPSLPAATMSTDASADSGGSLTSKAQNAERQTDLKTLQSQLEAYYAQKGNYPTLAQLNSASWRTVNMKGLDNKALEDPTASGTPALGTSATTSLYGYKTQVCTASGSSCQGYELTAILSTGKTLTEKSLN